MHGRNSSQLVPHLLRCWVPPAGHETIGDQVDDLKIVLGVTRRVESLADTDSQIAEDVELLRRMLEA